MARQRLSDSQIIASIPDGIPVGIWVARAPGGELVYTNATFRHIMGVPGRDDVRAGHYAEPYRIHGLDGAPYPEAEMPFAMALRVGATVMVDDIVIHRDDGAKVNIRAYARPVAHAGEISHVVVAFLDITREVEARRAQREADERARQSQRLEAIGNLAGGIAHDFNNLLGAIRIIASTLAATERDPERLKSLETIEASTVSARELTRSLLGFAGKVANETYQPVYLDGVIRGVAGLLGRALDPRFRLVLELGASQPVLGDAPRLEQVVMNLVINAHEAMPDGGTITVRTEDGDGEVRIDVIDEGPGIPVEHRSRIFEPYFTTRRSAPGRGSGLGLATVFGIVSSHDGTVRVVDSVRGAHLEVTLPATDSAPTWRPTAIKSYPPPTSARRVLVVDDEDLVREAATLALEAIGYQVDAASSGDEAIVMYAIDTSRYDLVLLDLAMPGMDGRRTLRELHRIDPEVRAVLASGYGLGDEERTLADVGLRGTLEKPYGIDCLRTVVGAALTD